MKPSELGKHGSREGHRMHLVDLGGKNKNIMQTWRQGIKGRIYMCMYVITIKTASTYMEFQSNPHGVRGDFLA